MPKYVVKAYSCAVADPAYFDTDDKDRTIKTLEDYGFIWIEAREIKNTTPRINAALKRCKTGSRAEMCNLRSLFNHNN